MKLFLVSRTDEVGWDECRAAVVCAASTEDAVAVLREEYADRLDDPWQGFEHLKVEKLDRSCKRGVKVVDFRAG